MLSRRRLVIKVKGSSLNFFPQPQFQVFQNPLYFNRFMKNFPKPLTTFYEIEISESNNYQLLRKFEEIDFKNKMTPCLLGIYFKILGSQLTRQLSKLFDTVLPVGVDSRRKTMIRNNLEGGSSRRLSVTRLNLYLCWSGRCFNQQRKRRKRGGKRSGRGIEEVEIHIKHNPSF